MIEDFSFYIALVIAIVLLVMLANKIKVAYPVVLVIAGLLISLLPGFPVLHIDPNLIFIIFLPPLLYEAAWAISWKELWRWRRIILSFAFPVVLITAVSVALVANAFIPGFSLALGFLLGGIVSPPDAVSAGAILKFVKVPKRFSSILEGESLLNDASALIIFRFALVAVATGQFVWYHAALNFGWMVLGGVGIGILLALIFMKAHQKLPTDANIDTILTLVAPFIMYIAAEEAHSSGVLAVVSGGLFLSKRRYLFINSSSRLKGFNVWESLVFILNGLVFLLIGLELPEIVSGLEGVSLSTAIGYGLLVTLVLIVVRIFAAYGAAILTLIMRNFIKVADPRPPGLKAPFILGWSGMRGVISLAAALSIPFTLESGAPFPQRNVVLFITFIVILTTLLLQGLTLPYFIQIMDFPKFDDHLPDEEANHKIKRALLKYTSQLIHEKYGDRIKDKSALHQLAQRWQDSNEDLPLKLSEEKKAAYLELLNKQRGLLLSLNSVENRIDEDIIRKYLQKIDLEEEKIKLG
ncbi:MAG: Na+/H+ antiporter [Bacteroidetes bacterium]|nr:Na+/H+ antiporter [Bacteroidota bacterium]